LALKAEETEVRKAYGKENKGTEGKIGDGLLNLRHMGVTRLNVLPAGLTARVVVWRKAKTFESFLALQIEGNMSADWNGKPEYGPDNFHVLSTRKAELTLKRKEREITTSIWDM
jgi:hypothetical protein